MGRGVAVFQFYSKLNVGFALLFLSPFIITGHSYSVILTPLDTHTHHTHACLSTHLHLVLLFLPFPFFECNSLVEFHTMREVCMSDSMDVTVVK